MVVPVALALILAPAPEAAAGEYAAFGERPAPVGASAPTRDLTAEIPGSREVDLSGMDPALQPEFLRVVAGVARHYGLRVPFILPRARWNGVTGAPSAGAHMFASDLGIGFDPGVWNERRSPSVLLSVAHSPHTAANGKTFAGLVVHEMGHVLLAERFGVGLLADDNAARLLVQEYRLRQGADGITAELGAYAWRGSRERAQEAWQETFAEAFAASYLDPHSLSEATSRLVARVLRLPEEDLPGSRAR